LLIVDVLVGSDVKVTEATGNAVEDATIMSLGVTTGVFELHEEMMIPTLASKSSGDFDVLIFCYSP
jgi:hypothetical protein